MPKWDLDSSVTPLHSSHPEGNGRWTVWHGEEIGAESRVGSVPTVCSIESSSEAQTHPWD